MHRHGDVSFDLKCFLKESQLQNYQIGFWEVTRCSHDIAYICEVRLSRLLHMMIWIIINNLQHDGMILTELIFADAKNWLHRTATNSNTNTRI